jgi:hypothetical protein
MQQASTEDETLTVSVAPSNQLPAHSQSSAWLLSPLAIEYVEPVPLSRTVLVETRSPSLRGTSDSGGVRNPGNAH